MDSTLRLFSRFDMSRPISNGLKYLKKSRLKVQKHIVSETTGGAAIADIEACLAVQRGLRNLAVNPRHGTFLTLPDGWKCRAKDRFEPTFNGFLRQATCERTPDIGVHRDKNSQ